MGKESFLIYKSFYKPISKLSDKQLGRLFRAIFKYQLGEIITVEEDIEIAFEFFKNQFEIDENKYHGIVERNRSNGSKGGAPKRAKNDNSDDIGTTQINPNNPVGFSEPKKADNDNDNVSDNNNSLSSAHTRENLGDISSETFDMDLDKCFADLKSEEGWLRDAWERAYRNGFRNFTLDECKDKYVDLYYWKLKGEGVTHKSVSDAKRHFSNWLITELKKQKDDRARTKTFSRATTDPTGKVICGETETGTDIQSGGASQKDYSARF